MIFSISLRGVPPRFFKNQSISSSFRRSLRIMLLTRATSPEHTHFCHAYSHQVGSWRIMEKLIPVPSHLFPKNYNFKPRRFVLHFVYNLGEIEKVIIICFIFNTYFCDSVMFFKNFFVLLSDRNQMLIPSGITNFVWHTSSQRGRR